MSSVRLASDTRCELGEAALWDPEGACLHWLDLPGRRHHCLPDGASDPRTRALATGEQLACLARLGDGLLLVSATRGWRLAGSGLEPMDLALPSLDAARTCFNDGKVDRHGHLWLGSSDLAEEAPLGKLWRIAPDGTQAEVDAGFIVSNGPAFSPDGRVAYFADTFAGRILAYDLDRTGAPVGRRVLHEGGPGYPDGLTVDAEGRIYSCRWGGGTILVLGPDGGEVGRIDVPASNVTSAAFGGPELDRLYVTTAAVDCPEGSSHAEGALFAANGVARGLAEPAFGGGDGRAVRIGRPFGTA